MDLNTGKDGAVAVADDWLFRTVIHRPKIAEYLVPEGAY